METKTEIEQLKEALTEVVDELKKLDNYNYFEAVVTSIGRLSKELQLKLSDVEKAAKTFPELPEPNISVKTPEVRVDAPDLSGIETLLKTELPKIVQQLAEAIPEAPETDLSGVEKGLHNLLLTMAEVRDRKIPVPQMPTTLKVVNPDGSLVSKVPTPLIDVEFDYIGFSNADTAGNYQTLVFKKGGVVAPVARTLTLTYDANESVSSIARS